MIAENAVVHTATPAIAAATARREKVGRPASDRAPCQRPRTNRSSKNWYDQIERGGALANPSPRLSRAIARLAHAAAHQRWNGGASPRARRRKRDAIRIAEAHWTHRPRVEMSSEIFIRTEASGSRRLADDETDPAAARIGDGGHP